MFINFYNSEHVDNIKYWITFLNLEHCFNFVYDESNQCTYTLFQININES